MAAHPYRILNVFTRAGGALTGNPLCVFEDGQDFSAEVMQALARQFNLSETTFILPVTAASGATTDRAAARVRIFTPSYEMPFAGHPTLGTAHVCRALGLGGDSLVLQTAAGLIPVQAAQDRWTLTALKPTWRELDVKPEALAAALGLRASDLGERPLWVKAGKEQLLVPLDSVDAVRRTAPHPESLRRLRSEDGNSMALVFAFQSDGVMARFFFSQGDAILEDPATGSAAANLGGWWLAMERDLPMRLHISQGELIKRPSSLYLTVTTGGEIRVGGDVIQIGAGTINI